MENFETIIADKCLEHIGEFVGIMRLRVISESLGDQFYHWASWLEANGNENDCSEYIGGTRMVVYGMTNPCYAT